MSRNFRFVRTYVGKVKAAILDWSGTTADKYVLAPAVVFVDVFEKHKVIFVIIDYETFRNMHIQ